MDEQHVPPPSLPKPPRPDWKRQIFTPKSLRVIFASLAIGALASAGGWYVWLKPQLAVARLRYKTTADIYTLYQLQVRYKEEKGVYASSLDSLLTLEPDAAARKARMGRHLDLTTLAVVGDAKKFRIEANVLDPERTFIKILGPIRNGPPPRGNVVVPLGAGVDGDGRPITPGAARRGR